MQIDKKARFKILIAEFKDASKFISYICFWKFLERTEPNFSNAFYFKRNECTLLSKDKLEEISLFKQ